MRRLVVYLICGVVGALFLANANMAAASELVYTPINPSFGGSPLNAQWLMNSAEAQNRFEEEIDLMEEFEEMLNRQVLLRITRNIIIETFGEEDVFYPGHYEVGNYAIDMSTDGVVITVVMTDMLTGESTTIAVPYYG